MAKKPLTPKEKAERRRLNLLKNPRYRYVIYIHSDKWDTVKQKYKKTYCEICNTDKYLSLHHFTYKNLERETGEDFVTLCGNCHQCCHFTYDDGKYRKLSKPSKAMIKVVHGIRYKQKVSMDSFCIFLRNRYIAIFGYDYVPQFDVFRLFYKDSIQYKHHPFNNALNKYFYKYFITWREANTKTK
jgi:uncharacterized cysteine cluster protein YcgN (CxxCxxCC family)